MALETRVGSGITLPAEVNGQTGRAIRTSVRNEIVIADFKHQMVADGKVFMAGIGVEDTPIADQAAFNDTTPMFGLQAPDAGTVVIPLAFILGIDIEGGAAVAQFNVVYDDADRNLTGTELSDIRNMRGDGPQTPNASMLHTVTADAGDGVTVTHMEWPDNILSAESIGPEGGQIRWSVEKDLGGYPIYLVNGGSFLVYSSTGSSRTSYSPFFVWAEYSTTEAYSSS